MKPIAWTIAGSDSGGGAGIQADLHTFQALGVHGCSVITAITAQNSVAINHIQCASADNLSQQVMVLSQDLPAAAIKVGMVGNVELLRCIALFLQNYSGFVVVDPVLSASCGPALSVEDLVVQYLEYLLPRADLFTPNILEAQTLLQRTIITAEDVIAAAAEFMLLGARSVVIKGGHAHGEYSQDYWTDGVESFWLSSDRIDTVHTHGSGCVYSSAVAAAIVLGHTLKDALVIAKMVVTQGIRAAVALGQGAGPVQHLSWPRQQQDLPKLTLTEDVPHYTFAPCDGIGFYPIVDRAEWLEKLLPLGVRTVQLRVKDLQGDALAFEIQRAVNIAKKYSAQLFINDYWQLAIQHDAYGVHLGQEDLASADLAAIAAQGLRLGISTHCYYEVARAHAIAPSYVACGPIYFTNSKVMPFEPQGLEKLQYWRDLLDYPLVAIGAITLERAPGVLKTGVDGIAVISAVTKAEDPIAATRAFLTLERYVRQIILPGVGEEGQQRLGRATVLCVGAGGLGAPVLMYLVAAGVGHIGVVDGDQVELSNLQRQVLFNEQDVGLNKVDVVKAKLQAMNRHVRVTSYVGNLDYDNAQSIMADYHIVVDCTDNFDTKYLLNDVCFYLKKPLVTASVLQLSGQCAVFNPPLSACYRCVYPEVGAQTQTCNNAGVLGVAPGMLGVLQATEVIKLIVGVGRTLVNRLLIVDLLTSEFKTIGLRRDPECVLCAKQTPLFELHKMSSASAVASVISAQEFLALGSSEYFLLDVREAHEHADRNIGGVNIPLSDLDNNIDQLPREQLIIVYCQSGSRSSRAVRLLQEHGFLAVKSLTGGAPRGKTAPQVLQK